MVPETTCGACLNSRAISLAGLDVELVGIETEALRVVHRGCRLHAKKDLVRSAVVRGDVVRVVRRDERDVKILLHLQRIASQTCLSGPRPWS